MTQVPSATDEHRRHPRGGVRSSRKPRYQQLADILREEIGRGDPPVGRFLASESVLCKRFRCSRHTVREALRLLDELGLIRRRRGAGSEVRSAEAHVQFDQVIHSIDDLLQYTDATNFRARHTDRILANTQLAGWLEIRAGSECILLYGVRHGRRSRQPIAVNIIYRRALWQGLPTGHERQEDAIQAMLQGDFLARVSRVEQILSAVAMPAEPAHDLRVPIGSPALRSLRRYFDAKGRLTLVTVSFHPADTFRYTMRYERREHAGSA